jgi:hypothetical protein
MFHHAGWELERIFPISANEGQLDQTCTDSALGYVRLANWEG